MNFVSSYRGQISVGIALGNGASLQIGGNFTPGTIMASWIGQQGAPETLSPGQQLAID